MESTKEKTNLKDAITYLETQGLEVVYAPEYARFKAFDKYIASQPRGKRFVYVTSNQSLGGRKPILGVTTSFQTKNLEEAIEFQVQLSRAIEIATIGNQMIAKQWQDS